MGNNTADTQTSKKPHDTPFKQQKLKAWQPILTPKSVISTFLIIAVIFIPIGIAILVASNEVIDVGPIRYDKASDNDTMLVKFTWPESTSDSVYVYYQLSNFYQNHRRYVKSRSDVQLSGSSLADVRSLGDCDPWEHFSDVTPNTFDAINFGGRSDDEINALPLNPCGLIANSKFNDTLNLFEGECVATPCPNQVSMSGSGIAWSSDRDKKFKNLNGFDGTPTVDQQQDVENEEFIVWMRTAGLPTFKKLHRIIRGGLDKGEYTMVIDQNFPVKSFDGEKAFYLSTVTWIGGKNDFLGWAYISVGILCVLLAAGFFIKHTLDPRSLGDPRSMKEWKS